MRGAHQHPGAVAVEDEYGRLLSLDKLSLQVPVLPSATSLPLHVIFRGLFQCHLPAGCLGAMVKWPGEAELASAMLTVPSSSRGMGVRQQSPVTKSARASM